MFNKKRSSPWRSIARCGTFTLGTKHSSKEAAEANIVGNEDYIKTIKIEI